MKVKIEPENKKDERRLSLIERQLGLSKDELEDDLAVQVSEMPPSIRRISTGESEEPVEKTIPVAS